MVLLMILKNLNMQKTGTVISGVSGGFGVITSGLNKGMKVERQQ